MKVRGSSLLFLVCYCFSCDVYLCGTKGGIYSKARLGLRYDYETKKGLRYDYL